MPAKSKGRDDRLQAVIEDARSLVFYESPRRVQDTVEAIARILGERQVVVCRELTKTFESIHGLPASEMLVWLGEDENRCRGEIVLVVAGANKTEEELLTEAIRTLGLLVTELPLKKRQPSPPRSTGSRRTRSTSTASNITEADKCRPEASLGVLSSVINSVKTQLQVYPRCRTRL